LASIISYSDFKYQVWFQSNTSLPRNKLFRVAGNEVKIMLAQLKLSLAIANLQKNTDTLNTINLDARRPCLFEGVGWE
jgi:hypothetical protein